MPGCAQDPMCWCSICFALHPGNGLACPTCGWAGAARACVHGGLRRRLGGDWLIEILPALRDRLEGERGGLADGRHFLCNGPSDSEGWTGQTEPSRPRRRCRGRGGSRHRGEGGSVVVCHALACRRDGPNGRSGGEQTPEPRRVVQWEAVPLPTTVVTTSTDGGLESPSNDV
jgi:hypothetical protein